MAASALQIDAQAIPFEKLAAGLQGSSLSLVGPEEVDLSRIETVVVRSMPPGSLEQVVFRMDLLWSWEQTGIQVVNSPKGLECAIDKYLTLIRLQRDGIPVPPTLVSESTEQALSGFAELGGDVVVKPIFGAEGRGIMRLSDPDHAWRIFRTLEQTGQVIYQQKYLDHGGWDLRLLVLDGQILGAMKRTSEGDFRTNLARSGRAEAYEPTDEERQLSIAAAKAVGVRFAGVDLIRDRSGELFVIEVNGVPGWKGLQQTTNIPIAQTFWQTICSRNTSSS